MGEQMEAPAERGFGAETDVATRPRTIEDSRQDAAVISVRNETNTDIESRAGEAVSEAVRGAEGVSEDAVEYFSDPNHARELASFAANYALEVSREAGRGGFDQTIDRYNAQVEDEARKITKQQRESIFARLVATYARNFGENLADAYRQHKGTSSGTAVVTVMGATARSLEEEHGMAGASRDFLERAREGLSETEQRDLLRAALESRQFSARDIFQLEREWNLTPEIGPDTIRREREMSRTPGAEMSMFSVTHDIIEQMINQYRNAQDEETKRRVEREMERVLGRGTASRTIGQLEGRAAPETVLIVLDVEIQAKMALHQGRPEDVVPGRRQAMA